MARMCISILLILTFGIFYLDGASLGNSQVKFSIASSRNRTGHWNALVKFQHEDNDGRPLELDLNHTTSKLGNKDNVLIVASLSGPRQISGPDYELLPGLSYYKFHTSPKNWYEARKTCEQEGAHLAIMNSEAEAKALRKFWIPYLKLFDDWRNNWAFVGIHDHYSEGNFVTIFDVPVNETGFNIWQNGHINGGSSQNCVLFHRDMGLYEDDPCSDVLPFFCEQDF